MTDNLHIWNTLGRTNPDQTKSFSRAGGFKGTAIKPVYTEQKMTELFGPCGIGWGFTEPTFQLVPASDGQTAVYCWLSLWYVHDGVRSAPIPGVGGDLVVVKQSSGLRTDDEAFKKAFTDAIGNAMKHLGMSADVHMGRFDDSKYVQELREESRAHADDAEAGVSPQMRANFIAECEKKIAKFQSDEAVKKWWNSDERRLQFEQFDLSGAECDALKNKALARRRYILDSVRPAA